MDWVLYNAIRKYVFHSGAAKPFYDAKGRVYVIFTMGTLGFTSYGCCSRAAKVRLVHQIYNSEYLSTYFYRYFMFRK